MRVFTMTLVNDTHAIQYQVAAFSPEEATAIIQRILGVQIMERTEEKKERLTLEEVTEPTPEEVEKLNKLFGV